MSSVLYGFEWKGVYLPTEDDKLTTAVLLRRHNKDTL